MVQSYLLAPKESFIEIFINIRKGGNIVEPGPAFEMKVKASEIAVDGSDHTKPVVG